METYRGLVMAQETDSNGHMNVQFYTTRYDQATAQFMAQIGIDFHEIKRRNLGFAYVEMTIRYIQEVLEDDPVHITTSVVEVRNKVATLRHQLFLSVCGQLASEAVAKWVTFDKTTRKAVPLDEQVKAAMQQLVLESPSR